jgi:heme/copper-type cytochrome/quinol oxidase subunit 4
MNIFEFYKELYFHEIDRKERLDSSVSIPITIITAIIAVMYFLISNFDYTLGISLSISFIITIVITLIFLIISIYQLLILYNNLSSGYKYSYFPFVSDLNKYQNELRDYYSDLGEDKAKGDSEFNEYLKDNIIKHIDYNIIRNDSRSLTLYKTKKYLLFALLFLFLTLIPFGINYFQKPEKPQKIELVNKP